MKSIMSILATTVLEVAPTFTGKPFEVHFICLIIILLYFILSFHCIFKAVSLKTDVFKVVYDYIL